MSRTTLRGLFGLIACVSVASCVLVPNPNHEEFAGSETGSETGDGDGDDPSTTTMPSGDGDGDDTATTMPTGDGDGDSGDGDGDTTTASGDGDGDPNCEPGTLDCTCTVLEQCDEGLACVLGGCIDASSCGPVDDNVQVSVQRNYMGGDPQPVPPMSPTNFICSFTATDQGTSASLQISGCNNALLQSLTMSIAPKQAPLEELFDVPLAASVTLVEAPEGFYMRLNAGGMDIYYGQGPSLFYDGITSYPWEIAPFFSACGATPSMCGQTERLAMLIDDVVLFDGNAGIVSDTASAWIERNLDVCGVNEFEFVLIDH